MEENLNEEINVRMFKDEKQGIWILMIFYLLSWGLIATPWGVMRLIGWIVLGLIGLAMWKIFDNLFARAKREKMEKDENEKGRSKK